jgi:sulfatase maturation enzyme AslB (radical SAM superfamily)
MTGTARWAMHFVLEELSSDMWSILPQRFTLEVLRQPLAGIGIDMNDAEHRGEVENFLESLRQDGSLVLEGSENPQPPQTSHLEPSQEITTIESQFDEALAKDGLLSGAMMELTYRCNEKCVHCFNPRTHYDASTDLTTDEVLKAINDLYAAGIYHIAFSGGEASVRDDIKEFFEIFDVFLSCQENGVVMNVIVDNFQIKRYAFLLQTGRVD